MTIGEDLFTILGIMPIRDRAGIQRSNMAVEASKAEQQAPAYSASAPMQMPTPPQFQIPPEMRGPGGQMQLSEDVPTAYASGSKSAMPIPRERAIMAGASGAPSMPAGQERVLASGPAAAPGAAVQTQASDVYAAALERNNQRQKMQQLIGSLGMIGNAFNRDPDSAEATQASLAGMVGGGRGGNNLAEIKTLLDMKKEEQAATQAAAGKEAIIQRAMRVDNMPRRDAEELWAAGKLTERWAPTELRKQQEDRTEEQLRKDLEPQIDDYARITGSDPNILRAQLKAAGGPQKLMELMSPEKRAGVRKLEGEGDKLDMENRQTVARLQAWRDIISNPKAATDMGLTPADVEAMRADPEALAKWASKYSEKRGELAGGRGTGAASQMREKFVATRVPETEAAESYLGGTGRQLGTLLMRDDLPVGTFAELRQSGILRPLATALGVNIEGLNSVAAVKSALAQAVVANGKRLPGPASDKDTGIFERIVGNPDLSIGELRTVVDQTERAYRRTIADNNKLHERNRTTSDEMRGEFNQVPKGVMPEPSEMLQANIYSEGNAKLRATLRRLHEKMDAAASTPDAKATEKEYVRARDYFDDYFGAETGRWYLEQERQ